MALPSAVVEEGVNKVFSYISTKLDDKALTADTIARIEIAVSRLDFVLEKTGKIAITYASLLRRWKIFKRVHMEGMDLLNKYKQQQPDGLEETGQAVDTFHSYVLPPSFIKERSAYDTEFFRPDPICCNGNSCGTLANKSSIEIPEPVILVYFGCCISAPKNSLRNAPLSPTGVFAPHVPCFTNGRICIKYGGKEETRNGGSVQQLEEIARSDALDYLVHEPEPTDYALFWLSTHGAALVTLRQSIQRRSRRVSKRKR